MEVPEGLYGHALKDVREQDSDPPCDDNEGGDVDGYSEATRRTEETKVEQE